MFRDIDTGWSRKVSVRNATSRKLQAGGFAGATVAIAEKPATHIGLAVLVILGAVTFGAAPAAAWSKNQLAAQQRYLACKTKLQAEPPCNDIWTRQCARRCHARYF